MRLREAKSVVLLVGGYDGSGNYGDVLQVATAIETVQRLPGAPLAVAIVERETLHHHRELVRRFEPQLGGAAFVHFQADGELPEDDLIELPSRALPRRSVIYVYGGGFLNHRWGARKADHVEAAEGLHSGRALPLVASGLQVDEAAVVPGGVAHDLLARASSLGVRDIRSLEFLKEHLPAAVARRVDLTGDDAVPFLRPGSVPPQPVVNLHLNDGIWVSDDPGAMAARVADLLCAAGRAAQVPLRLQPVVAYEDPRVSERRAIAALLDRFGGELEEAGYVIAEPLDLLDDALDGGLAGFSRARLTVACSYHVTLSSLLAGMPTVLLAANDYYEQKAVGLRDLFGLGEEGLVGARGDRADAEAAGKALADGAARSELLDRLQRAGGHVVERWERGRAAAMEALVDGLRPQRLRRALSRLGGG